MLVEFGHGRALGFEDIAHRVKEFTNAQEAAVEVPELAIRRVFYHLADGPAAKEHIGQKALKVAHRDMATGVACGDEQFDQAVPHLRMQERTSVQRDVGRFVREAFGTGIQNFRLEEILQRMMDDGN